MMRKMIARFIAAMLILMLSISTAAYAQVSGINILNMSAADHEPVWYFAVRALDQNGQASNARANEFRFVAGDAAVELKAEPLSGKQIGHIIVVDTSRYYDNSRNEYIKSEHVQAIISTYLSALSSDERVCFVLSSNGEPSITEYMSVDQAKNQTTTIKLDDERPTDINAAMAAAFQMAAQKEANAPAINSVFIVADPDIKHNPDSGHSLGAEAALIRDHSGQSFDVMVAMPYRKAFMNEVKGDRLEDLKKGFEAFKQFAQQLGGKYIELQQNNDGVETDALHIALSSWADTARYYAVDFSALSGHVPADGKVQSIPLSVYCHDDSGQAVRTVEVLLNTALLPEPELTATPEPSLGPTLTPAPTPVVRMEQTDARAMRAISALSSLGYLEKKEYKEFNSLCYDAYVEFCKNNHLDVEIDGIFEDAFEILISPGAIAAATPTPTPTATPVPAVPAQGYRLNDEDPEDGSGFIAKMQTILSSLNCFEEDAQTRNGRFDEPTLAAVNKYCENYGWTNDLVNGVSKRICDDILTNGPERKPIEEAEPNLREKLNLFLHQEIHLGSFVVSMWIPVLICIVFVFLILLMIILLQRGKEKPAQPAAPEKPKAPAAQVQEASDEIETAPQYFTRLITLAVNYAGQNRAVEAELREGRVYTIGRRDDCQLILDGADKKASRLHAELYFKNNQVYVRDVSSYQNTTLNGLKVRRGDGENTASGTPVNNGDVLQLSEHMITVRW